MGRGDLSRDPPGILHLDPVARAAAASRQHVRNFLQKLGRPELIDSAELGVSELVTNAALHARTPMSVTVSVTPEGGVRIGVRDSSPGMAVQRHYGTSATTGRGLRLVQGVSLRWGIDRNESAAGPGKTVWFEPAAEVGNVAVDMGWGLEKVLV